MYKENRDDRVVQGFGEEWSRFPQETLADTERGAIFEDYFAIFPWAELPVQALGADIGCGSGRWAAIVAPQVGRLVCVDASADALAVAHRNLVGMGNVAFHQADVGGLPFAEGELDFAYSLGVLHHVPDIVSAIASVARTLKPGGIFLLYLYYAFDNRPWWFCLLWRVSDGLRRLISRLPSLFRFIICDLIAALVYWPLARTAALLDKLRLAPVNFPLWYYRNKSFYVMRTDALDRFGTRLEKRFSRVQIQEMLEAAGFGEIRFSDAQPFWCALGIKAKSSV
jgi:SAM-dependent methyltransferase